MKFSIENCKVMHMGKKNHSGFTYNIMGSRLTIFTEEHGSCLIMKSSMKTPLSPHASLWTMAEPAFYFHYFVLLKNNTARGTQQLSPDN